MKTTRRVTTLLLVLSVLVHLQCSQGKKAKKDNPGAEPRVTLKQSYPPGKYKMVVAMDQTQKIEGDGLPQSMQSTMTVEMLMDASQGGADGSRTVKMAYTRFGMVGSGMNVDTNAPAPAPGSPQSVVDRVYRAMIGHELVITLGSDDKVLAVTGFEALWDKVSAATPPEGQAMLASLKQSMGDESLKKMMAGGEQFMPPHPVGVGAVWHSKTTLGAPIIGDVDMEFECELAELTDTPAGKVARVTFVGKLESEGGGSLPVANAAVDMGEIDIKQEGSMLLNVANGIISKMEMRQTGTIEMSVKAPDGTTKDMTSHMDQTITTTITPAE